MSYRARTGSSRASHKAWIAIVLIAGSMVSCSRAQTRTPARTSSGTIGLEADSGATEVESGNQEPSDANISGVPSSPESSLDLSWDNHIGWEPRYIFAPGERSRRRPEGSYLTLRSSMLDSPQMFRALAERSGGVALRDKPLVAEPEELCHGTLHDVVRDLAPDRLLVHVHGGIDATQRDCLARLPVRDLFLSLCRHDGAMPSMDGCPDGDAVLTTLVSSPALRQKLRGLAIGFGERQSWALLPQLTRLKYLTIRARALENVDIEEAFRLCDLQDLRYVDILDANQPGLRFDLFPGRCFENWETFISWSAPDPRGLRECSLRRLFVWELDAARRTQLEAACPHLTEIEVVRP